MSSDDGVGCGILRVIMIIIEMTMAISGNNNDTHFYKGECIS